MSSIPISLQLYTVRDEMAKDFEGTLAKVAQMGYRHVEFAGFYNHTPEQVRQLCDRLGLKGSGVHFGIDEMRDKLGNAIKTAKTLGVKHMILPWIGADYRGAEGYRQAVKVLNDAAKQAKPEGLTVCYHNHSFEFEPLDGGAGGKPLRGMDILYGDPNIQFQAELDVYWVQHGRDNPVDWIRRLSGKVPLLHIKDMDRTAERGFTEVGAGILDMKAVVQAAKPAGVQYFIIEQDANWNGSPLDSVKTSLNNFRKILGS